MAAGPVATLKRLWRSNRWLTLGFILTITLALVFLIRASVFFVYWQAHADEPIEGWMTVRYVAKSYRVAPGLVHDAIGLPPTGPDRRPLIKIAEQQGRSVEALAGEILAAVDRVRRNRGQAPPPHEPQPPSETPAPARP
ncbi:hypothetical protein [Hoeflea olei]|uniref:Uncharacterized protein n=1 Tax=Hoeflea olei TaxID=1480615 RepID=A0A1C1YZ51_9HYPH|nr:hypothetical protein [Hoeflea olei]OCW58752.1 hypothetical protein AWJ14_00560 [Hoeflea olei]